MDSTITNEPITVSVSSAMKYSGLGRTKLYELLATGEIKSVWIGGRRLIVFASLKARLLGEQTNA